VSGLENLLGQAIVAIRENASADAPEDGKTRQEYDTLYSYTFETAKGYADIEFRNSSNGYYGGELVRYDGAIPKEADMRPLVSDYLA
jgi:hypothetical protein